MVAPNDPALVHTKLFVFFTLADFPRQKNQAAAPTVPRKQRIVDI